MSITRDSTYIDIDTRGVKFSFNASNFELLQPEDPDYQWLVWRGCTPENNHPEIHIVRFKEGCDITYTHGGEGMILPLTPAEYVDLVRETMAALAEKEQQVA